MCIVHLIEVDPLTEGDVATAGDVLTVGRGFEVRLAKSSWFTRGWTLQELVASKTTVFCSGDWTVLGAMLVADGIVSKVWKLVKDMVTLNGTLASITGVPIEVLDKASEILSFSVAQRMSWAANRQTTREEDRAYSLLGLFDINLPLLYGEGSKAFKRLEHEIIRQSSDETIFIFRENTGQDDLADFDRLQRLNEPPIRLPSRASLKDYRRRPRALLAYSPDQFFDSRQVEYAKFIPRYPYRMTNQGLEIRLETNNTFTTGEEDEHGLILLKLNCINNAGFEAHGEEGTPWSYWHVFERQRCFHYGLKDTFVEWEREPVDVFTAPTKLTEKVDGAADWECIESDLTIWVHTSDSTDSNGEPMCG
ncbi:hypothetical protein LTS12_028590 [Elasticomyces elasticus]|nr:hypothetical protein LTS12_028590 [Elasticomyces elasticus]